MTFTGILLGAEAGLTGIQLFYQGLMSRATAQRAKQFMSFLDKLAKYMNMNSALEMQLWIEEHWDKEDNEWLFEGFDQGFRAVLDTLNETAKKCAIIMVADYLKNARHPNRFFRQHALLFQECDDRVLKVLLTITDEIVARSSPRVGVVLGKQVEQGKPDATGPVIVGLGGHVNEDKLFLEVGSPFVFYNVCDILIRVGFLSTWASEGKIYPQRQGFQVSEYMGMAEGHQVSLFTSLQTYLAPVRELG